MKGGDGGRRPPRPAPRAGHQYMSSLYRWQLPGALGVDRRPRVLAVLRCRVGKGLSARLALAGVLLLSRQRVCETNQLVLAGVALLTCHALTPLAPRPPALHPVVTPWPCALPSRSAHGQGAHLPVLGPAGLDWLAGDDHFAASNLLHFRHHDW